MLGALLNLETRLLTVSAPAPLSPCSIGQPPRLPARPARAEFQLCLPLPPLLPPPPPLRGLCHTLPITAAPAQLSRRRTNETKTNPNGAQCWLTERNETRRRRAYCCVGAASATRNVERGERRPRSRTRRQARFPLQSS